MKSTKLSIYFNVVRQVHTVAKKKKASTKRGHLIAQYHNTEVEWYVKPCNFEQICFGKELRQILVEWIMKIQMCVNLQYPVILYL